MVNYTPPKYTGMLIPEEIIVTIHAEETDKPIRSEESPVFQYIDDKHNISGEYKSTSPCMCDAEKVIENVPTTGFEIVRAPDPNGNAYESMMRTLTMKDPRGFVFAVNSVNIVYILKNMGDNTSIKDIPFVYAWTEGKQKILMPVTAEDYNEACEYSRNIYHPGKIYAKDLIEGASYIDRESREWMYVGKYMTYKSYYSWSDERGTVHDEKTLHDVPEKFRSTPDEMMRFKPNKKLFFFVRNRYDSPFYPNWEVFACPRTSDKITRCIDQTPSKMLDNAVNAVKHMHEFFPTDPSKSETIVYPLEDFKVFCRAIKRNDIKIRAHSFLSANSGLDMESTYSVKYGGDDKGWVIRVYTDEESSVINILDSIEEMYDWLKPAFRRNYLMNGECEDIKRLNPSDFSDSVMAS